MTHAFARQAIEIDCTVDISRTADSLHAHVELDGSPEIRPGDRVIVQGAPLEVAHGESVVVRRRATILRSARVEHLLVRAGAYFGLTGLLEIGFSVGRDR